MRGLPARPHRRPARRGLLARGWTAKADRFRRLSEAAPIRALIGRYAQDALLAACFPEGLPNGREDEARARRCLAFGDALALRRVNG